MHHTKIYELSNHLGNVLTVISDRKIAVVNAGSPTVVDHFSSEILSAHDYYVYHFEMKGRSVNASNDYRYGGSNGQEKDNEIFEGAYTAEHWEYDSRIGRRWNRDPIVKCHESPYTTFANNPILMTDVHGDNAGTKLDAEKGVATVSAKVYLVQGNTNDKAFKDYADGYSCRIDKAYSGKTFVKDNVKYTVQTDITVIVVGSIQEAQNMIANNKEDNISNILTVGESDHKGADSKTYSGSTGFMNVSGLADPHEMGHLLRLSDRYDNFLIRSNYANKKGDYTIPKKGMGGAPRYLNPSYDPEYAKDPSNNMMSIRNADGVLTSQQLSFVFSHGNCVVPDTKGHSENLAVPTTYFFQGGFPPVILGKPGVNTGKGSYSPTNGCSGEGQKYYDKFKEEVNGLYER